MKAFDSGYAGKDREIRARHGKIWTPYEEDKLRELFRAGSNLVSMCAQMQRPAAGVLARLVKLKLLNRGIVDPWKYYYVERPTVSPEHIIHHACKSATPKETAMPAPTPVIETRTLIHGRDAANMTDTEIFGLIGELESKIKKLEGIEAKPKKLVAAIDALKVDIAKLVDYVDTRE